MPGAHSYGPLYCFTWRPALSLYMARPMLSYGFIPASRYPNQHTRTALNFPELGLGGHNSCRNPTGEESTPWCYTLQPGVRFEVCDVPSPSVNCSLKTSQNPYATPRADT